MPHERTLGRDLPPVDELPEYILDAIRSPEARRVRPDAAYGLMPQDVWTGIAVEVYGATIRKPDRGPYLDENWLPAEDSLPTNILQMLLDAYKHLDSPIGYDYRHIVENVETVHRASEILNRSGQAMRIGPKVTD